MEKQFEVIVNHNGSCGGYHYKMGEKIILPESVVNALGNNVGILQDVTPYPKVEEKKEEVKVEEKDEPKQEKKEIKFPPKDKMVKGPGKSK